MPTETETKTMTIMEFRYWLEGVEEMQPEGWSPDKRQWDRIREKIDSIVSNTASQAVAQTLQHFPSNNRPEPVYHEQMNDKPIQYAPSGVGRVAAPPPSGVLFGNADNPTFPIKTPTIDTSKGGYEPAFI